MQILIHATQAGNSVAQREGEQLATKIAAKGCKTCPSKYSHATSTQLTTNAEHGQLPGLRTV